jgi:hypothetical protein
MRTTITLDDDVEKRLRQISKRTNKSFKELVNETLRRGLAAGVRPGPPSQRFVVRAKACGFRPGVDPLKLNQLLDEMEASDFAAGSHFQNPPREQ